MVNGIDFISLLLPTIISAIIAFVILGVSKFSKTSDTTVVSGVMIENMKVSLGELQSHVDNEFKLLDKQIEDREEKSKIAMRELLQRLSEMNSEVRVLEYKMSRLEKDYDILYAKIDRLISANKSNGAAIK